MFSVGQQGTVKRGGEKFSTRGVGGQKFTSSRGLDGTCWKLLRFCQALQHSGWFCVSPQSLLVRVKPGEELHVEGRGALLVQKQERMNRYPGNVNCSHDDAEHML